MTTSIVSRYQGQKKNIQRQIERKENWDLGKLKCIKNENAEMLVNNMKLMKDERATIWNCSMTTSVGI